MTIELNIVSGSKYTKYNKKHTFLSATTFSFSQNASAKHTHINKD